MKKRIAVLAVVVLAACSGAEPAETVACEEWLDIADDLVDGILTEPEFRGRVIELTTVAEGSELEETTRDVLADLTAGSLEYTPAMRTLTASCADYL